MRTRPTLTPGRAARPRHPDGSRRLHHRRVGTRRCLTLLLAVSVLGGCAGAGRGGGEPVRYADAPLLAAEIRRAGVEDRAGQTAYDAVHLLRVGFLQIAGHGARGGLEPAETVVYVEGARVGGLEVLHSIPLRKVAAIRLIKPLDATTAFGPGHGAGALIVELVR